MRAIQPRAAHLPLRVAVGLSLAAWFALVLAGTLGWFLGWRAARADVERLAGEVGVHTAAAFAADERWVAAQDSAAWWASVASAAEAERIEAVQSWAAARSRADSHPAAVRAATSRLTDDSLSTVATRVLRARLGGAGRAVDGSDG